MTTAQESTSQAAPAQAVAPTGLCHLALNVRDLDRSHQFWTEIMGFRQVGEMRPDPKRKGLRRVRYYCGTGGNNHDLTLLEVPGMDQAAKDAPPPDWSVAPTTSGLNHLAVHYSDRESWLQQLRFLQGKGVPFHRRIDHGASHSIYVSDPDGHGIEVDYELAREYWEEDLDASLNYLKQYPTEGEAALEDDLDPPKFTRQ